MPFAYRALVEKRQWLSGPEFAALVGVAQVLPGPTICNMAVMVGMRKGGRMGGVTSLLGMVVGPMIIVLLARYRLSTRGQCRRSPVGIAWHVSSRGRSHLRYRRKNGPKRIRRGAFGMVTTSCHDAVVACWRLSVSD